MTLDNFDYDCSMKNFFFFLTYLIFYQTENSLTFLISHVWVCHYTKNKIIIIQTKQINNQIIIGVLVWIGS